MEAPLSDGFSGLPVRSRAEFGPATGTIEWLVEAVERHANAEANALEQYEVLATSSGDPIVQLVMRLILDDEQRHHGLLRRIEASLRDALNWTRSPDALPTDRRARPSAEAGNLVQLTNELIAEEHTGARYIRGLAQQEKGINGGLHSLLLEMMAQDSEKHAYMLQFVHDRLARG